MWSRCLLLWQKHSGLDQGGPVIVIVIVIVIVVVIVIFIVIRLGSRWSCDKSMFVKRKVLGNTQWVSISILVLFKMHLHLI